MSKTIKVIDLLNKIANGETPKKIKMFGEFYCKNEDSIDCLYINEDGIKWTKNADIWLNDEIEIIEEQEEIDIQSIEDIKDIFIENSSCGEDVKYLARKYNEILKWAKQLDKEIKEK